MELFFPPNSIKQGLRFCPQERAILRPTAVLPVKLILRTAGCSIMVLTTSGASCGRHETKFRQPGGRPASSKARTRAQYEQGEFSEDFRMVVLPAARAHAAPRTPKTYGAFL